MSMLLAKSQLTPILYEEPVYSAQSHCLLLVVYFPSFGLRLDLFPMIPMSMSMLLGRQSKALRGKHFT